MSELQEQKPSRKPFLSIVITLLIVLIGFQLVGPLIGMIVAYPFYPGDHLAFAEAIKDPFDHPEFKVTLLVMQGMGTFFGMIILPLFFLRSQQRGLGSLFQGYSYALPFLLVVLVVIVFMGVNSVFIDWNRNISFPGDDWAREIEENLAKGTEYLTNFSSPSDFVLAFVVIAVLPALGEEIVFRGMVQNDLLRATRNPHLAIWVAAILFSAFHVQFFGFVPRMLLGALFGYLYYWSGNLWYPVTAHFVNNGFTIIALYLHQKGLLGFDIEDTSIQTPWQAVVFSALCTGLLLYGFKNFYNHNPKSDIPD